MNQKLSDWASIAEIVSGIAVVVSLVFLILGIQENTEVTRASMYDRNMDSLIQVRDKVVSDPDIADLWIAYREGETGSLSEADRLRIEMLIYNVFGVYEKAYFAHKYRVLGESEWGRYAGQICFQYARVLFGGDARIRLEGVVTTEFLDYIEEVCSDGSAATE